MKGGKMINTMEIQHTSVDLRCCFLTKCPKSEKYKRTKTKNNLKRNGKKQKIRCIFGRNRKIQKANKSTRCIFWFLFLIQNKYKNTKKNTDPKSQKYKIQTHTNPKSRKYKVPKKKQFQNVQSTKYKKYKFNLCSQILL